MGTQSAYTPLRIASQARRLMEQGIMRTEPVWYQPVLNTPPTTDYSRKPSQPHQGRPRNRPSDIRKIQTIQKGWEVHFRRKFYKQHPWELARPKVVVEEDGADYIRLDWSKLEQIGKPLDGESVVQRALYLMNELKSPAERYQEIHGFDESQARGRPAPSLPKYGNIAETNPEAESMLQKWYEMGDQLVDLEHQRDLLLGQMKSIQEESESHTDLRETDEVREANKRASTPRTEETKPEKQLSKSESESEFELPQHKRKDLKRLESRKKNLETAIFKAQKRMRKACRISPDVAYLQACSEFYLLRQQEEVETRIAIEQAKCFGRQMGPTVNEKELEKEGKILKEWRAVAHRQYTLLFETKGEKNASAANANNDEGKNENTAEPIKED